MTKTEITNQIVKLSEQARQLRNAITQCKLMVSQARSDEDTRLADSYSKEIGKLMDELAEVEKARLKLIIARG